MESHYRIDVTLTRIDVTSVEEQVALRERQVALAEAQERVIAMHAPVEAINRGMPLISQSIYRESLREQSPRDYKPKVEEVEVFSLTAKANEPDHLTAKVTGLLESYHDDEALALEMDGPTENGSVDPEPQSLGEAMDLPETEVKEINVRSRSGQTRRTRVLKD